MLFLELVMGAIVSGTPHCPCKAAGMGLMLQELVLDTELCTWLPGELLGILGMLGSEISFVPELPLTIPGSSPKFLESRRGHPGAAV